MPRPKKNYIWEHFRAITTTIEENNKKKKIQQYQCKYCGKLYKQDNITKKTEHLVKCEKVPIAIQKKIEVKNPQKKNLSRPCLNHENKGVEDFDDPEEICLIERQRQSVAKEKDTELSNDATATMCVDQAQSSRKKTICSYMDNLSSADQETAVKKLCKAIYCTGAPLSMLDHPLWKEAFQFIRPKLELPSSYTVRNTELNQQFSDMESEINQKLDQEATLHLQLDGWSNIRNQGIINFVITTPQPYFIKTVDTKAQRHTGEYICSELEKVLEEYGPEKFFTIISDNAANMKRAFALLKQKYPHLVPMNCMAHTLHLLVNDFLTISSINLLQKDTNLAVNTIINSQILRALVIEFNSADGINHSLVQAVKTRWGSCVDSLQSLLICQQSIKRLAINKEAEEVFKSSKNKEVKTLKYKFVDDDFWGQVEVLKDLLKPITDNIKFFEGDSPKIHLVYEKIKNMEDIVLAKLNEFPFKNDDEKILAEDKLFERKNQILKKIHYTAVILNPADRGESLPHDLYLDGLEFLIQTAQNFGINEKDISDELMDYKEKKGKIYSREILWGACIDRLTPLAWWKMFSKTGCLGLIAVKILSASVTSSQTERTFSTYSWIHNKRRNRLTAERAGKITYLAQNWKLLNREQHKNNINDNNNSNNRSDGNVEPEEDEEFFDANDEDDIDLSSDIGSRNELDDYNVEYLEDENLDQDGADNDIIIFQI